MAEQPVPHGNLAASESTAIQRRVRLSASSVDLLCSLGQVGFVWSNSTAPPVNRNKVARRPISAASSTPRAALLRVSSGCARVNSSLCPFAHCADVIDWADSSHADLLTVANLAFRQHKSPSAKVMERCKLVQLFFCAVILQAVRGLSDARLAEYMQESSKEQEWLVGIRRELHQWPELMYEEHNTSLFLRKALDDLGIPYK